MEPVRPPFASWTDSLQALLGPAQRTRESSVSEQALANKVWTPLRDEQSQTRCAAKTSNTEALWPGTEALERIAERLLSYLCKGKGNRQSYLIDESSAPKWPGTLCRRRSASALGPCSQGQSLFPGGLTPPRKKKAKRDGPQTGPRAICRHRPAPPLAELTPVGLALHSPDSPLWISGSTKLDEAGWITSEITISGYEQYLPPPSLFPLLSYVSACCI